MKKDEEYPIRKMNDYFVHPVIFILLLVLFKPIRMRDALKKKNRNRILFHDIYSSPKRWWHIYI